MTSKKLRVAFTLFGDGSWTGGINYLHNLFHAISLLPGRPVVPVLFVSPDTNSSIVDDLRVYLDEPPVVVAAWKNTKWNNIKGLVERGVFQCDRASLSAFKSANIDSVFQNDRWYGFAFPMPTLVWIADFQHKHLGDMFTRYRRMKRDVAYSMLCRSATKIMVSSQDSGNDCQAFFPCSTGKISVVPFAVQSDISMSASEPSEILAVHNIPNKYFYFPGQLWKHKNHMALLDALLLLKRMGSDVVVVASGNPQDCRNPEHPRRVLEGIKKKGLENNFLFLGMVPYGHIMPLMRGSAAMINPSLFEGWSTTVEEAKALGIPMLLSDLRVHREQASQSCLFFDPRDSKNMAKVMREAWQELEAGPRYEVEKLAANKYAKGKIVFAEKFQVLAEETVRVNG